MKKEKKEDLILFATNLTKRVTDPSKGKEHYKLFLKNKATKIPKPSKTVKTPNKSDIMSLLKP